MLVSNALIGLREGLEAALVVVILVAFLVKTDRRWALKYVWLGVATAVVLSMGLAAFLTYGTQQLTFEQQELIGGIASIIAVAFVTGMIFWMRTAARTISGELKGRIDKALDDGSVGGRPGRVPRRRSRGPGDRDLLLRHRPGRRRGNTQPLIGLLLGIGGAVLLGFGIYRGALRINLGRFFTLTGVAADLRGGRDPRVRHPRPAGGRRSCPA